MIIKTLKQRLADSQRENDALRAALNKTDALLVYTAMMTDVELPEEDADE